MNFERLFCICSKRRLSFKLFASAFSIFSLGCFYWNTGAPKDFFNQTRTIRSHHCTCRDTTWWCKDSPARRTIVLVPVEKTFDTTLSEKTWAPYTCGQYAFVGDCPKCNYSMPASVELASSSRLWIKVRAMLLDALVRFPDSKFFFKMDSDTYLIPEHLYLYLEQASPGDSPIFHGSTLINHGLEYAQGGAGYLLSRSALELMSPHVEECSELRGEPAVSGNGWEDYFVGACMRRVGVTPTHVDGFVSVTVEDIFEDPPFWWIADLEMKNRWHRLQPPYVPQHPITFHRYKRKQSYLALHTLLRFFRLAIP